MRLGHRQKDGSTLRQHLHAAVAAGAPADPLLQVALPASGATIWAVFCDLSRARPQGMSAGGIPPSEIVAWQQLHGTQLSSWEVDTLAAIDAAALAVSADLRAKDAH